MKPFIYIGTAGWSIPRAVSAEFPGKGTHLEKYARQFHGVEINTTFYRPHKSQTFQRWAASVPEDFRFMVKIPKAITHEQKLVGSGPALEAFLEPLASLGENLGGLLVQLPPSLQFDSALALTFLNELRANYSGPVAFEPRHPSWFVAEATQVMVHQRIARVAADPAVIPDAAIPSGSNELAYWRLHGSPRVYYSPYTDDALARIVKQLQLARAAGTTAWCIFDNTASGAAAADALKLRAVAG